MPFTQLPSVITSYKTRLYFSISLYPLSCERAVSLLHRKWVWTQRMANMYWLFFCVSEDNPSASHILAHLSWQNHCEHEGGPAAIIPTTQTRGLRCGEGRERAHPANKWWVRSSDSHCLAPKPDFWESLEEESGGAKLEAGTSVRKQEQWSGERGGHLKRWDVAQQDSPMGSIVGSKRRQDRTKADAPIFILSSWLMAGALYWGRKTGAEQVGGDQEVYLGRVDWSHLWGIQLSPSKDQVWTDVEQPVLLRAPCIKGLELATGCHPRCIYEST